MEDEFSIVYLNVKSAESSLRYYMQKLADLSEGMVMATFEFTRSQRRNAKIAILGNPSCIREDDLDDVVVI